MAVQKVFKRYEYKYLLTRGAERAFTERDGRVHDPG